MPQVSPRSVAPTEPAPTESGRTDRSRWLALGVLAASALMTILDGSIVTVAMPAIQSDLHFSPAGLSWVMNSYLLAFGGLLLLSGRLGDLIGRRTMFLAGTAVFGLSSVLAGAANSAALLIAARFLQGVGSAMASAVSLGILVTLFDDPKERGKAFAVFSFTGAAGASIGQVLGGVLTDALSWHWIFLINVPIGIATLTAGVKAVPSDRGLGLKAGADVLGALLVTSGLMLAIFTVVKTADNGWASAQTLGLGAGAAALVAAFFVRQAKAAAPLMPLRILRNRNSSGANVLQMLMISAMFAFQIMVALYMQRVLGYTALQTGLAMLPAALSIGGVALFLSARLIHRFGARNVMLAGLTLLALSLLLLLRLPVHGSYVRDLLPTMLLIAGGGLAMPAAAGLGMSAARPEDAGLASGLYNTTGQIGMATGAAVLSTMAASRTGGLLADGRSTAEALTSGYHLAFGIGLGLLVAALAVTAVVLRRESAADAAGAGADAGAGAGADADEAKAAHLAAA